MSTTIKGKNIDVSKVAFSQPRVLDNGAKLVYMNYDGGRLSIQTPWMSLPWKMGVYTEGEYPKYSVDLSFKGMENDPDLQAFHDKFQELENKILDGDLKSVGVNPETGLVEIIEKLNHPWFIGVQFHPEYKSTVSNPHPLFVSFIKASMNITKTK